MRSIRIVKKLKLLKVPVRGLFVHIAKTGGLSIWDSIEKGKFNCYYGNHQCSIIIKSQVGSKNWNSMFKFCFVRNPYDRVVSFYHFITQIIIPDFEKELCARKQEMGKLTFREFCFMFSNNNILKYSPGMTEQHHYITNKNGQIIVDYVGRYEKLQQDWDYLCENIFYHKCTLPHKNCSNHRENYMSYYDEETKQIISNYYKKDFEIFGYEA